MGFRSWLHYCTNVIQQRSTKLCTLFGHLRHWYTIYTFSGALAPSNRILPGEKFTLRPSLALSYTGSISARHSSRKRRRAEGATYIRKGRPSRWALAHMQNLSQNYSSYPNANTNRATFNPRLRTYILYFNIAFYFLLVPKPHSKQRLRLILQ